MSMAVIVFFIFRGIQLPKWPEKVVMFVAPSMFSVYLLHSHLVGETIIRELQGSMVSFGLPTWLSIVGCAISVFVGCIVIDLVRRVVACLIKSPVDEILTRIDCFEEALANRIVRTLVHV